MNKALIAIIFIFTISNQFVFSQEENENVKHPILTHEFQFGAGIFLPTQKIKFSVDAFSDNNVINFDETFDFNHDQARPQFTFDWRFVKKWKLSLEYFDASHTKRAVLEEDIKAGGFLFKSGSHVDVGYKINLYRIYFGRVISSGEKYELGGGLGFHLLNIGPFIKGNIIVNDNDNEFKNVSLSILAPLPNIALWYYYAPNQKWAFTSRLDWFGLSVNGKSASLWDFGPSIRYQIIKNLGIALDYRYFKINANINNKYWKGSADLSFSGPTITLIGHF